VDYVVSERLGTLIISPGRDVTYQCGVDVPCAAVTFSPLAFNCTEL